MQIVFSSVYMFSPWRDYSLPNPDCFHPPTGMFTVRMGTEQLIPTAPASSVLATLTACSKSLVYTDATKCQTSA